MTASGAAKAAPLSFFPTVRVKSTYAGFMTWRWLLAGGLVLLALPPSAAGAAAPASSAQVVMYRDISRPGAETRANEQRLGFTATHRYGYAVKGFSARLTQRQVDELRRDPNVRAIVPDAAVHADSEPLVAGGTLPVGLPRIWAASGANVRDAAGPAVALLDTGIDLTNTDLNVAAGTNCVGSGPPQDGHGHGTHVAGTIAALNNGDRVVGVAPGTQLYAVKVLGDDGSGTVSSIICGLDWVTANATALGIKVVNMSLGGTGPVGTCGSDPEHAAVCRVVNSGVTIVAAAGNDGDPLTSPGGGHVPGSYPEVLAVTAMDDTDGAPGGLGPSCSNDADDGPASFSNYGSAAEAGHIIAAPGGCVVSLAIGSGLRTMSGTSMATPHVTAAAALCIAEGVTPGPCAGQSPAGVIATLRSIAEAGATPSNGFDGDPLHPIGTRYYGYLLRAAVPPAVTTDAASSLGDHDAALAGTIVPSGAASSWWFEYGTTTAYGDTTSAQDEAPAGAAIPVQSLVSGLDSGTTYHYRVVMQTGEWTIHGTDQTLTTTGTPPPPPPDTQITSAPPARTASTGLNIAFTASPAAGSSFECRLDAGTWSDCTTPYTGTASEGPHTFAVRATNGKPDLTPATTTWTVDLTPPDTVIRTGPTSPTSSSSATFAFTASELPSTFECRLDGGAWAPCTSPYPVTNIAPGQHRFEVRASDGAGWTDATPASYDWIVSAPAEQAPPASNPPVDFVTAAPALPKPAAKPLARVVPRGAVRLDRRSGRLSVTLQCLGPGACAGRVSVLIRGLKVAVSDFRIAAGASGSLNLKLGRRGRRVLERPAPRTAGLALTRSDETSLARSVIRLSTRADRSRS